jgi:transcriptional regulator with XRE-family HTH domain
MIMSRLGQRVKEIRIKKGLTPKALAKKAGVSESFLLEAEDGRKILNDSLVNRLSKILEVNLNENGDFYASVTEEFQERKAAAAAKAPARSTAANTAAAVKSAAPSEPPAPQWEQAFSAVIKDVPVYDQNLSKVLYHKKLVIQDNKVDGIPMDKAYYIQIENSEMNTLKFKKGDLVFVHKVGDLQNAGVYVIRYQDAVRICEVKPLNSSLLLLGANRGALATETANIKEVTIVGKCVRAEVSL